MDKIVDHKIEVEHKSVNSLQSYGRVSRIVKGRWLFLEMSWDLSH